MAPHESPAPDSSSSRQQKSESSSSRLQLPRGAFIHLLIAIAWLLMLNSYVLHHHATPLAAASGGRGRIPTNSDTSKLIGEVARVDNHSDKQRQGEGRDKREGTGGNMMSGGGIGNSASTSASQRAAEDRNHLFENMMKVHDKYLKPEQKDKGQPMVDWSVAISSFLDIAADPDAAKPAPDYFSGRGIVSCAGGVGYMVPLYANVKMLRRHGCTLSIEVWCFAGEEPTPTLREEFTALNVSFHVIDEIESGASLLIKKFMLKVYAVIFSSFAEVLYLDADVTSTRDPSFLFDTAEYKKDGALFWADYWEETVSDKILDSFNITRGEWIGSHDSGIQVIDKRRAWPAVTLAFMTGLYPDLLPALTLNGYGIGDKELFPLLFRALRIPYHRSQYHVTMVGYGNSKAIFHGSTMGQRDVSGKLLFLHKNCEKWSVSAIRGERNFLQTREWTHLLNQDVTGRKRRQRDGEQEPLDDPTTAEYWNNYAHAVQIRASRKSYGVCDLTMHGKAVVHPLTDEVNDIDELEANCRKELDAFVRSEAYYDYRWRRISMFGEPLEA